ncbi:MAG: 1-acyl-sn-glycerol-3-phosphate acyltransferase [Flavobacteriales bacterium]|nr:1-acyl-sn-glycerol-3-phosphate acyltransferase [Flavobacteriales bacterium]
MFRPFAQVLFRLMGWRVVDHRPQDLGSCIYVVAPHSSNWDFIIGLLARSIARLGHVRYLAKKELFRPPFGWLFRILGGYPVDRSKRSDVVGQVVQYFKEVPGFTIAITPEGTRRHVDKWKTGFYHIAVQAGVPLIMASIDYGPRVVTFREPFVPSGDVDRDVQWMMDYFSQFSGKNRPAKAVPPKTA